MMAVLPKTKKKRRRCRNDILIALFLVVLLLLSFAFYSYVSKRAQYLPDDQIIKSIPKTIQAGPDSVGKVSADREFEIANAGRAHGRPPLTRVPASRDLNDGDDAPQRGIQD